MPFINLIHEKRVSLKRQGAQRKLALGAVLSIGLIGFGTVGTLFLQTEALNGEAGRLQAEVDRMEPILDMIAATQNQYNVLNPRLTTLQEAALVTQRWNRILDHMSRSCPPSVWLTVMRCSQNQEEEPVRVEIQGLSPDQQNVSDLILRLQSSLDLENVNLKYTQPERKDESVLIKFEISGDIVGTAKPKPAPEEGEGNAEGSQS